MVLLDGLRLQHIVVMRRMHHQQLPASGKKRFALHSTTEMRKHPCLLRVSLPSWARPPRSHRAGPPAQPHAATLVLVHCSHLLSLTRHSPRASLAWVALIRTSRRARGRPRRWLATHRPRSWLMAIVLQGLPAARASLCSRQLAMAAQVWQTHQHPRITEQPGSLVSLQLVQLTLVQAHSSPRQHLPSFAALLRNLCLAAGQTLPAVTVQGQHHWRARRRLSCPPPALVTQSLIVPGCHPPLHRRLPKTGASRKAWCNPPARRSAALRRRLFFWMSPLHLRPLCQ